MYFGDKLCNVQLHVNTAIPTISKSQCFVLFLSLSENMYRQFISVIKGHCG